VTLRKVREFTPPTDEKSARALVRQLTDFEQNTANETAAIRLETLQVLQSVSRDQSESGADLAPGQSIGVDTLSGDVEIVLAAPQAKFAGKFAAVYKRSASNTLTLRLAGSDLINGATSLAITAAGLRTIFCDGVEYWA
jgi:hypothetical protein